MISHADNISSPVYWFSIMPEHSDLIDGDKPTLIGFEGFRIIPDKIATSSPVERVK